MQKIIIAGNVGNVKEVRSVGETQVLNFSIAVDNGKDKNGERRESTWYDCSLWGKRAQSLAPYISKGQKMTVFGRPTARAHDGKAYLGVEVDDLTFQGGGQNDSGSRGASHEEAAGRETEYKSVSGSYDLTDNIPF